MTKTTLTAAFSQMVHTVDKAFPSLFTKEDVIVVLKDLEEQLEAAMNGNEEETTTKISITEDQIKEIADNAASSVSSEGVDLVDDYDLTMNYREVELDSITLDESKISSEIERAIVDWFESNGIEIN
jgi:hypothetical protein